MLVLLTLLLHATSFSFGSSRQLHPRSQSMWEDVIHAQMLPFEEGITREKMDAAVNLVAALPSGGWHVLIVGGVLHMKPLGAAIGQEATSQRAGVPHGWASMLLKFLCQDSLADVEFVMQPSDVGAVPRGRSLPVFSFARNWYEEEDILFPYWSFVNTRHLRTFYEETPWESKLDTAVWRGSPTGVANDWMHLPRTSLVQRCSKPPLNTVRPSNSSGVHQTSPLCDAHFTNYKVGSSSLSSEMESVLGSVAPSIPSPTLSRYKYLILVDGNTAPSSRSTEVFFSHSAVIKQSSPLFEFFYPLLHPHIHYLPVAADFSDLVEVLEWAQNHDAYMKAMGITARAWAERHLSDSNVVAYVSQLLRRYHGLQRFTPTVDTDMLGWKVDVTDDVKNWISMETGKTCSNITTVAPAVVVVQR